MARNKKNVRTWRICDPSYNQIWSWGQWKCTPQTTSCCLLLHLASPCRYLPFTYCTLAMGLNQSSHVGIKPNSHPPNFQTPCSPITNPGMKSIFMTFHEHWILAQQRHIVAYLSTSMVSCGINRQVQWAHSSCCPIFFTGAPHLTHTHDLHLNPRDWLDMKITVDQKCL